MASHPMTALETAHRRTKGDHAALSLTLETLFDRYTKEGRHLPDGSLKTDGYLEHVRQTGRYLAKFFGRRQAVTELTPDRIHDYVVWRRGGGVPHPTRAREGPDPNGEEPEAPALGHGRHPWAARGCTGCSPIPASPDPVGLAHGAATERNPSPPVGGRELRQSHHSLAGRAR